MLPGWGGAKTAKIREDRRWRNWAGGRGCEHIAAVDENIAESYAEDE